MKKRIAIILLAVMITFTSACTGKGKAASGDVIKPGTEGGKPEITILFNKGDANLKNIRPIENYIKEFEERYGVQVKLIGIGNPSSGYFIGNQILPNEGIDEYNKELSVKMHQKDGPELLFYNNLSLNSLIRQNAAMDAKGKLSNLDKLYPGLVGDKVYYVPFALEYLPIVLNNSWLEEQKIAKPSLSWTQEDYINIKNKWLESSQREFTSIDFMDLIAKHISPIQIFNQDKTKIKINSAEMMEAVKSVKAEIYNEKYRLNQDYSYQNYYNMLFERQTEEYSKDRALIRSNDYSTTGLRDVKQEYRMNALFAGDTTAIFDTGNVVLPNVNDREPQIVSYGFMLNKNGKNLELACEFVNGLLDDDVQMEIYKEELLGFYPVNKNIEQNIRSIEKDRGFNEKAIELSQYLLKQIEKESASLSIEQDDKEQRMKWMLIKDLTMYIFADKEYSDSELSKELQKLEDKYNIYLSE